MPMPKSSDSKTHTTHAEAMKGHGGHNPNGVHGAHLNMAAVIKGSHDAEAAFLSGEYALLDVVDLDLGNGLEGTLFIKKKS